MVSCGLRGKISAVFASWNDIVHEVLKLRINGVMLWERDKEISCEIYIYIGYKTLTYFDYGNIMNALRASVNVRQDFDWKVHYNLIYQIVC